MKQLLSHIGSLYCCSSDRLFSREELIELIHEKEQAFQNQGIGGFKVSLIARSDVDFVTSLFGLLMANCSVLLMSPDQGSAEKSKLYAKFLSSFEIDGHQIHDLSFRTKSLLPAFNLSTSGTTGNPKIIECSVENLIEKINFLSQEIPAQDISVTASLLSLSFGHGLIGTLLFPLLTGNKVVLIGPAFDRLLQAVDLLNHHQVTFISATPHTYEFLFKNKDGRIHTLKRIQTASAHFEKSFLENLSLLAPNATIYNAYGLTEFFSWISFLKLTPVNLPNLIKLPKDSILWDDELQANTPEGLLYIKAEGHCHWPGIEDVKELNGEKYLGTGDYIKSTPDGHQIFSRQDDRISINAIKFYPQEIESYYRMLLGMDSYFVHVKELKINILLFENQDEKSQVELNKKVLELSTNLSIIKRPLRVLFLDKIPRTVRGKVSRKELESLCLKLIK